MSKKVRGSRADYMRDYYHKTKYNKRRAEHKRIQTDVDKILNWVVLLFKTNRCPRCTKKHDEDLDQYCLPLYSEYGIE